MKQQTDDIAMAQAKLMTLKSELKSGIQARQYNFNKIEELS